MERAIVCVVGTRPEAIKMAPVILALKKRGWGAVHVLSTGQHREMLDQTLDVFGISVDSKLTVMTHNHTLSELTSRIMIGASEVFDKVRPDTALVQGDTTSAFAAGLAAFYRKIPIGHVEAGLRTRDSDNPFPEEANRSMLAKLAKWHFAPTERARQNLLAEQVAERSVFLTGNTVIDALLEADARRIDTGLNLSPTKKVVLVTSHRRENFGEPIRRISAAIKELAERYPDIHIVWPVHPNPNIKGVVESILASLPNVQLCSPLGYAAFVSLMRRAHFIISDSGGIQEEAPALGKPVLVLRDETERPEAVGEGLVKLVGTHSDTIVVEATRLLDDENAHAAMARGYSPYGDGRAAERICDSLEASF